MLQTTFHRAGAKNPVWKRDWGGGLDQLEYVPTEASLVSKAVLIAPQRKDLATKDQSH